MTAGPPLVVSAPDASTGPEVDILLRADLTARSVIEYEQTDAAGRETSE